MFQIIGSLFALAVTIIGDRILSKWVAQMRLWYREKCDAAFKAKVDSQYDALAAEWENLKEGRESAIPK
jgi:hypothetical protein